MKKINEFDIIEKYFAKQPIQRKEVLLGIGDDCAIVEAPPNQSIAITTDTLIAGVHFPLTTSANDIGYKSLAVNLSDLASMGATPAWITLSLTLPEANEQWISEFCHGLFELTQRFHIQLIGGDLTHGPLSITIQAQGFISKDQVLRRDAAQPGDLIFVSHTLGDAAYGLEILQQKISLPPHQQHYFLKRLNRPEPRVAEGEAMLGIAHAGIDISDGLAADLGHILRKSCVGAKIFVNQIPLSTALREAVTTEKAIAFALNGGDDYELCVTVPENKKHLVPTSFTCIGVITEKKELDLRDAEDEHYPIVLTGYKHF